MLKLHQTLHDMNGFSKKKSNFDSIHLTATYSGELNEGCKIFYIILFIILFQGSLEQCLPTKCVVKKLFLKYRVQEVSKSLER